MTTYKDYAKQVFDWLLSKHKTDPNFTFSVRQKALKGSENNHFIGTEKSNYFSTTFWTIPAKYPGSSGDCISLQFKFTPSTFTYFFEFNQTRSPVDSQNKSVLNLIDSLIIPLKTTFGLQRELSKETKMLTLLPNPQKKKNMIHLRKCFLILKRT